MSLHASPSSEALARLHSQRRNSTITSIIIATLSLVLVGLLLGLLLLPPFLQQPQVTIIIPQHKKPTDPIIPPTFNPSHKPKPSSPASQTNPVLTSLDLSSISVPLVDAEIENPVPDFGDGEDFGDGTFGNGPENGMGPIGLPPVLHNRCSKQDRMARLLETGGTPQCEDAVVKGLDWLKSTQLPDGSWSRSQNPAAMTGLALLAYLGHCETPLSENYGDNVLRAIT